MHSVLRYMYIVDTVFCPHWLGLVGNNHHSDNTYCVLVTETELTACIYRVKYIH